MNEIETLQMPKALQTSDEEIYKRGEEEAKKAGYKAGEELDSYITGFGGTINYSASMKEDDDHTTGSIIVHGAKKFDIYLPTFTGPLRDRFTIGHELGHYFLHFKEGKIQGKLERSGKGRIEWEANCFASGFLMNGEEFKALLKEGASEERIAMHFLVSIMAVQLRRKILKC